MGRATCELQNMCLSYDMDATSCCAIVVEKRLAFTKTSYGECLADLIRNLEYGVNILRMQQYPMYSEQPSCC